ncbi:sacsin-like isoform X3 [Montipora capricornis]|uniref:sacsin-like isoform X3 n=1 Tax=Montipora capricornis TaxID=246305 RepID=UPI0035F1CE0D
MVLKILILVLVPRSDDLQTFFSCWKAALALPMRALTSASVPPVLSTMLPSAWPDINVVDFKWKRLLDPLLQALCREKVIYTPRGGGRWLKVEDSVFNKVDDEYLKELLSRVLLEANQDIACLPNHAWKAINLHGNIKKEITPSLVRDVLKGTPMCYRNLVRQEKLLLLMFVLSAEDDNYAKLEGLELLPLASGVFRSFSYSSETIYIASSDHPRELFPNIEDHFLDKEIPEDLLRGLQTVANKGGTQLRQLHQDDVITVLQKSLPHDWSEGETVKWYPGVATHNHPQKKWLELVWTYLRKNFGTREELGRFQGIPLIPFDMSQLPIELERLKLPSRIVVRGLHGASLDEILTDVLKKLGLIVIQELPVFLGQHPAVTQSFVHAPSPQGVLKALSAAYLSAERISMHYVSNDGKRSLRNFVSTMPRLESHEKDLLCRLPLFETLSKSFVSKQSGLSAAPQSSFPLDFRREFVDVRQEDAKRLAQLLQIRIPTETDFLIEELFPDVKKRAYSDEEIDHLMSFVMERYPVYAKSDHRFEVEMVSLPFVSTLHGRVKAVEVFNPRNEFLRNIFANEDVFPTGKHYTDSAALVVLEKLGLKGEAEITAQDVHQSARKIAGMSDKTTAEKKAKAIMEYFCRNPNNVEKSLGPLLQDIPWMPGQRQKPQGFPRSLTFRGESDQDTHFFKPSEVFCADKVNLIGAVTPIVHVDSFCELAKCLNLDRMPDVLDVVENLKVVTHCYTQQEKPSYMTIVEDIYSFLNVATISSDNKEALQGDENFSWIWTGDGFSPPKAVLAEKPLIDLTPYISYLPSEVKHFSNLFSKFGMRERSDTLLLLQVLEMIKQKYDKGCGFGEVEAKRDLQMAVDILNEIKPNVGERLPDELQEKVLIPICVKGDSSVKLVPAEECMYCEREWLETLDDEVDMKYSYVHPNIPNSTAELLQVRSRTNCMLEPDEIGDEFGQEEPLTRRLSRLLEDYSDGFAVPKELIQNADDAGATEVRFLYDERANEGALTCLIDEGMKECQGPALWVFNDAEFRDEDFQNITKLNGGTKELRTEKIGKFGLGFNAVYNLTDVPMFLSRNYFVILDPNTFHLGKIIRNKSKPGIKIDINKNPDRLRTFRNQFKPFNGIFGCDLHLNKHDNSFPGTLFRLPLRTTVQALRSEIKKEAYDSTQMRGLLEIFVRGAKTLLLFTQNVLRVRIFHLAKNSNEQTPPQLMFEVKKTLSQVGVLRKLPIPVTLPETSKNICKDDQNLLKQSNFLKASTEIAERVMATNQSENDLLSSSFTIDMKSTLTEHGSGFFGEKDHLKNEIWLIASSMGKGKAMQVSEKYKGLLPSAGVAVQLISKECHKVVPLPHGGTVFCYLPLPINSGLPVHVNGAFAVASNRRYLKERTEDDKACTEDSWNSVLLKDSVCAAYLDLLEDLKLNTEMSPFSLLWPKAFVVKPNYEPLACSFYQEVSNGNRFLFSDGKRWLDINQVVFLEPKFRHEPQIGDTSFEVFRLLVKGNKAAIELPLDVFQSFLRYGLMEKIQSKLYDRDRFFYDLVFPNIPIIPPELRDKLILYALDDKSGTFDKQLRNCACIPTTPNGRTLKCPRELVNPNKDVAQLFRSEDQRFPWGTKETFLSSQRLAKLEEVGMMANDLPWNIIGERAESISTLNRESSEAALKRTKALLDLLARKLIKGEENSLSEGIQNRLVHAKFLPVVKKPREFPLPWKGDDRLEKHQPMISPKEAFPHSQKYLVCCSEPMADLSMSSEVRTFLCLDKKHVTIEHVLSQLHFASATNTRRLEYLELEELKRICSESYHYLQTALDNRAFGEEQMRRLKENRYIFTGGEFVDTNHVAFDLAVDCQPYLYRLPREIAGRFHSLMMMFGVKESFEKKDFMASLELIKSNFGESEVDGKTLQVAIHLAGELAKCVTESHEGSCDVEESNKVVYLPDSQGVMRPAKDLCLNNCPWLPAEFDTKYANEMIPLPTSIALGVKTRREEALKRFVVGIPFGQREKLTNRLQRILSAYPCEKEILKELLQNADDAEATEICFIKDPRRHCDDRVFADSWNALQGPALCVYNNKPFTEADIAGIQSLGEGSKGDDPNKTGQYGVGFNAVYHLTDVPSFISSGPEIGDVLCVFDPHCKYVPGATPYSPGRKFTETAKLKCIFPDVFSGYLEEHYPIQNSTMFRFPLRTSDMAKQSKISGKPVTLESLEMMMEALKGELFEALLFVNSVRKITLSDVDQNGDVSNSYFVEAQMSDEDLAKRRQFSKCVKECGKSRGKNGVLPINAEVKKCSYILHLRDSTGYEEKWFIVQQIGFEKNVKQSIIDAFKNHDLGMLPRGGVACLLEKKLRDRSHSETKERAGKAYCFLPLPIETDLPIHINGHFALDHEARRNLWTNTTDDYRSDWNTALVTDVIASCYLTLLDEIRRFHLLPVPQNAYHTTPGGITSAVAIEAYEERFPPVVMGNAYWTILTKSVYQEMDRKRLRLLPVFRHQASAEVQLTWLPPTGKGEDKAFFNNLEEARCLSFKERVTFQQVLLQTGFNLVAFSMSICASLEQSDVRPACISPAAVREFFKSFQHEDSLCKIGPIPADVTETPFSNASVVELVLRYCKEDKEFLTSLPGLPLLLTEDNYLRTFSVGDPTFLSRHYAILPECKEMFVHHHIRTHIFSDLKSANAPVFKQFDVNSFAANLERTLSKAYFNSEVYLRWCPDQTAIPNPDWLGRVWNFLSENINNELKELQGTGGVEIEKIEKAFRESRISFDERKRFIEAARIKEKEEKISIIRDKLKPLNYWSILPCTETIRSTQAHSKSSSGVTTKHFLVPLRLAESVLDFPIARGASNSRLVETLRILGLPEVNCHMMTTSTGSVGPKFMDSRILARTLVGSLETPASLLKSFKQKMMEEPHSLEGKLTPPEGVLILQYFSDHVKYLQPNDKDTLKLVPFYETRDGRLVSLNNQQACRVPCDIPQNGMQALEKQVDVIFLKGRLTLDPLFKFLDLEAVTEADIYCKFILRYFHIFSDGERLVHLEFMREFIRQNPTKPVDEGQKQGLLQCLRNTAILLCTDGTLRKASCFYDPNNTVFKTMLTEDKFPPEPFNSPPWLRFLKAIGLVHKVSCDHFKSFALDLAREGAQFRTAITDQKSEVLVTHLFLRENVFDEGLLENVCDIKFVAANPVMPELRNIHRQYGESGDSGRLPYISFRGSVLEKHAGIVWTTAPLLPKWASPRKHRYQMSYSGWKSCDDYCNAILARLHVVTEPTVDLVTFHCQNVCFHQEKENERDLPPDHIITRASVMTKIYRFLQANTLTSTAIKDRLEHIPCLLVEQGKRFIKPRQVVIALNKEFEVGPFLYGMPEEFIEFKKLFEYLGCALSVKPFHYAMVLEMLQKKCTTNALEPNEKSKSFKALKGFFETLQDNPDDDLSFSSLYLPAIYLFDLSCEDTPLPVILKEAKSLLFDDAPHYHHRIANFHEFFVLDLKMANVRCNSGNYKDLVMSIPAALQPKMLSSVVEETFADKRDSPEIFDVGAARSLKIQLHSENFQRGVVRLIRHASHEHNEKVNEQLVVSVKNRLQNIQVYGMNKVVTHLVYKGDAILGSEAEVSYFLQKICNSERDVWNIYVNATKDEEKIKGKIALTLSRVIAEACRGLLRETAMFIPTMLCIMPNKIGSFLDENEIRQDDSYSEERSDLFPSPGSFIPIAEHHLLNPAFEFFKPGEYVGYELEDPGLNHEDGEATFIYAVIIEEVLNNHSTPLQKCYKINIGDDRERKLVPATDLYKFYRLQEIVSTAIVPSGQKGNAQEATEKDAVFKEISRTLEEAWRLPEDKKRKVIKRLILQWHPDRNPGNESFCTEVFQHIMNEIARLEKECVGANERQPSGSGYHHGSYSDFCGFWGARARQYTSRRRQYQDSYYQRYGSWAHRTVRTWPVPPSFCTMNPQPGEAKRWLRQAYADLEAVDNDIDSGKPSYEWACFKCHQAAEKGLKAAQYSRNASKTNVHNLVQNSLMLEDSKLATLSQDLEGQLGDSTRMRYPDQMQFPRIPNDVYTEEKARQALQVATQILYLVRRKCF